MKDCVVEKLEGERYFLGKLAEKKDIARLDSKSNKLDKDISNKNVMFRCTVVIVEHYKY